jgi:cell division protein FtsI/penicillin-binding protein 2
MKKRKIRKEKKRGPGLLIGGVVALIAAGVLVRQHGETPLDVRLTRGSIAETLRPSLQSNQFPPEIEIPFGNRVVKAQARYTLSLEHQAKVEKLLQSYRPDYGAFVALDAATGQVLVMASYSRNKLEPAAQNLALRASFPAASVFKIVTAAAALDQGVLSADTVIPFNGSYHTLYRRNVTDQTQGRWTRQITLREAFAKSVNTVFGKIGMYVLEPMQLQEYAERFQFNKTIASDIPVEAGQVQLPSEEAWGFAELASGFNRVSSMSPLQGAMMAAAVANDGIMMEPYIVEGLTSADGAVLYQAQTAPTSITMKPESAFELRRLMKETIVSGTSRSTFRSLLRKSAFQEMEMGGKTGSLRGLSPKGKCDWFVGYVRGEKSRIAVAALTVNEDKWRVKASYLARMFIEEYFKRR